MGKVNQGNEARAVLPLWMRFWRARGSGAVWCAVVPVTFGVLRGVEAQVAKPVRATEAEGIWGVYACFASASRLVHRLRSLQKMFGPRDTHNLLVASDAFNWVVLECVKMNEDETTSSSRIFIKILMTEMMEAMGLAKLKERFQDPELKHACAGMFPTDIPKNTRFSINYFTSINLGVLTEDMREWLKVCSVLLHFSNELILTSTF